MRRFLSPYVRSLWNVSPSVVDIPQAESPRPFLSTLGLHLPARAPAGARDNWFQAAGAHVAAHLVYSHHRFDPLGLRPVTQALVGVLEDARVEWLACRELPGLRRLWLPCHEVTITDAPTFENLLERLARSLLDPDYRDPHPWVTKGRALFFLDDTCDVLAMPQAQALQQAASLLGNDIGQMRLQFNARLYDVVPNYRDDNSCLWLGDLQRADTTHELPVGSGVKSVVSTETPRQSTAVLHHYPEWDRQVPMYRPDWCAVHDAPASCNAANQESEQIACSTLSTVWNRRRRKLSRQLDGDALDVDALVQLRVEQLSHSVIEPRVYLRWSDVPRRADTLVLVDASASTAQPFGHTGASVLAATLQVALRFAQSIQRASGTCAIHTFCSDGRHAVHYDRIKDFDAALDAGCVARLMGVRGRFSTRLGAALRHATRLISERQSVVRRVLLLTDGRPHDVDVHDPRYLVEDARQAVREAERSGVLIQCLSLDPSAHEPLVQVFGVGQVQTVSRFGAVPAAINRLASAGRY